MSAEPVNTCIENELSSQKKNIQENMQGISSPSQKSSNWYKRPASARNSLLIRFLLLNKIIIMTVLIK
jgi:hypothetical protein